MTEKDIIDSIVRQRKAKAICPISAAYELSGGALEILKLANESNEPNIWDYSLNQVFSMLNGLLRFDFAVVYMTDCGHFLIDDAQVSFFEAAWDPYFSFLLKVRKKGDDPHWARSLLMYCNKIYNKGRYYNIDVYNLLNAAVFSSEFWIREETIDLYDLRPGVTGLLRMIEIGACRKNKDTHIDEIWNDLRKLGIEKG